MNPINYSEIKNTKGSWLFEHNRNSILSPDTDGILCGLITNNVLGWNINGFYDNKILLENVECDGNEIFLDCEICDPSKRSVGNHFTFLGKEAEYLLDSKFSNCISPGRICGAKSLNEKYPFGTSHFLLSLYSSQIPNCNIIKGDSLDAIAPFLHADGVYETYVNYPENCKKWIEIMGMNEEWNPLKNMFHHFWDELSESMIDFRKNRDSFNYKKKRSGDKIVLSDDGKINESVLTQIGENTVKFKKEYASKKKGFIKMLCEKTGLLYDEKLWDKVFDSTYKVTTFSTEKTKSSAKQCLPMIGKDVFSFAQTYGDEVNWSIKSKQQPINMCLELDFPE